MMRVYQKPVVEVIRFQPMDFITTSGGTGVISVTQYTSAEAALDAACQGFTGKTQKFTCSDFGGYSASNAPTQNQEVEIGGIKFVYKGNHWKAQ